MCPINRYVAYLIILISFFSATISSDSYEEVLLSSIRVILSKYPYQYVFGQQLGGWENIINEGRSHAIDMQSVSSLQTLCSNSFESNLKRLACCSKYPYAFYYLHNIRIEDKKIFYYIGSNNNNNDSYIDSRLHHHQQHTGINQPLPRTIKLPDIISMIRQVQHRFNMEVVVVKEDFDPSLCSSFFNGSLHVAGRYTTHNLFHVGK